MKNIRKGPGYRWSHHHKTGMGEQTVSGYSIDNLDSKKYTEANSSYEKAFIIIREILSSDEYSKNFEEIQLLQACQDISDEIRSRRLLS
mgnify:CR=1 FL=1|tara:strand:+ start:410 stop:676 length:267 start_codon:yes stop_codon:yes gene_type:complete